MLANDSNIIAEKTGGIYVKKPGKVLFENTILDNPADEIACKIAYIETGIYSDDNGGVYFNREIAQEYLNYLKNYDPDNPAEYK